MKKNLYIAEKPSVALEFARVLGITGPKRNGYIESESSVVTWCVGHLVNMSYPEKYDEELKKWRLETLPFIPDDFKYEVIDNVRSQFQTVKTQLEREDVETIYVCTDSGREGEYIFRLVDMMANTKNKIKKRVWIDSQTEEEIQRGIREAKNLTEYDNLSDAAYLRAIEDYLIGINCSRVFTLIYGNIISNILNTKYSVIAIGRVMTCVLGMIVQREREIRNFIKSTYYKINAISAGNSFKYKVDEESIHFNSPRLFNETGFKEEKDAQDFVKYLKENNEPIMGEVVEVTKTKEKRNPPLLYNLAELQNDCSKRMKISPDETLKIVQELYEKKLVTYPRTDARVISTAVVKVIDKNLTGLLSYKFKEEVQKILDEKKYINLGKTKYVDDKKITDHYAIIPTGVGVNGAGKLGHEQAIVFEMIVRRFLAIFFESAEYNKLTIKAKIKTESFYLNSKVCIKRGYLDILDDTEKDENEGNAESNLSSFKKGQSITIEELEIKEGETTPPKRYTSGSIILAMENAGKLIDDAQLREQIKGSGIGTSATRAEILNKLERIEYINLNKKTQILTPALTGEIIYDIVKNSMTSLLEPNFTASWEKGLSMIEQGEISKNEYMQKLNGYIEKNINKLKQIKNQPMIFKQILNIPKDIIKGRCKCCNGEILENSKTFYCSNYKFGCEFKIWKNELESFDATIDRKLIDEVMCKGSAVVIRDNGESVEVIIKDNKKGGLVCDKKST
ncbi:MAG TPA: DNA topoisomerase III [Clostridiales bacterium]|nr:MAG: DNA topoisomerase III [Clostridiales bacterium GWD2_32_19]HCC08249.1 DNA topoisomerase III [Clostridiales bacterium]